MSDSPEDNSAAHSTRGTGSSLGDFCLSWLYCCVPVYLALFIIILIFGGASKEFLEVQLVGISVIVSFIIIKFDF